MRAGPQRLGLAGMTVCGATWRVKSGAMSGVLFVDPLPVGPALHMADPIGVGQIPLDGFSDTGLKSFGGLPTQFGLEFAGIDGIAAVVSRTVGDIADLAGVTAAIGPRTHFIEQFANGLHDLDVGFFVPATYVIGLAQTPGLQNPTNCAAMVLDVKPIANLLTISLDS